MNLPLPVSDSESAASYFRLYFILFFLLAYSSANAQLVQLSDTSLHQLDITANALIYRDISGTATLADVEKIDFQPLERDNFLVPYSNDAFWLKFEVKNSTSKNANWVLLWDNPLTENLSFYINDSTNRFIRKDFKILTAAQKELKTVSEEIKLPFQLSGREETTIYIRLKNQRGLYVKIFLFPQETYEIYRRDVIQRESTTNGLLLFRLGLIFLLSIFLINDVLFRAYSVLIFARTLAFWGLLNVMGSWFSSDPETINSFNFIFYNVGSIVNCVFVLFTLSAKKLPKWMVVFVWTIALASAISLVIAVITFHWFWLKMNVLLFIFSTFYIYFLYGYSIFKKHPVNVYYAIPFLLGITSYMLLNVRLLGWIDMDGVFAVAFLLFVAEIFAFIAFLGMYVKQTNANRNSAEIALALESSKMEQMRQVTQLKTDFFNNISHELRTPLTLLVSPLQELKRRNPADKVIGVMNHNARHLMNLINQLLDVSKLEAQKMELKLRRMDIARFLRITVGAFDSLAVSKNIRFDLAGIAVHIHGISDPDALNKIINNLLSNAFKFTPTGGTVSVSAAVTDNQMLRFEVADTGAGIDNKHLPHIFNRFYQAEMSDKRRYEGTGIGLALVHELVQLLKGNISVTSTPNEGTIFMVLLPIDEKLWQHELKNIEIAEFEVEGNQLMVVHDQENYEITTPNEHKPNDILLVVDDNADMRTYLRTIFKDNYQVLEAQNGKEGFQKAKELVPDIIISDLMMPEMDGFEFSQALKANFTTSHVPVVMLTAKAGRENRMTGYKFGVDQYITKPFDAEELVNVVQQLIYNRRQLRQIYSQEILTGEPAGEMVSTEETAFLQTLNQFLEQNFRETLNVQDMADKMNLSETQFRRKLKSLSELSPNNFLRKFRLRKAAQLLRSKEFSVSEVAFETGFNNLSYFSKAFQQEFGHLPSEHK